MTNAFESFAESTKPTFQVRREAATAKRSTALRQRREDDAELSRAARAAKREQLAEILAGPSGAEVAALQRVLRRLTLASAQELVAYVQGRPALRNAPFDVRHVALGLVGHAIALLRLREGLTPFDDSLPGSPDKAFHVVKSLLAVH